MSFNCRVCKETWTYKTCDNHSKKGNIPGFDYAYNWDIPDQFPMIHWTVEDCFLCKEINLTSPIKVGTKLFQDYKINSNVLHGGITDLLYEKCLNEFEKNLFNKQYSAYEIPFKPHLRMCKLGHKLIPSLIGREYQEVKTPKHFSVFIPNARFNVAENVWADDYRFALKLVLIDLLKKNILIYSPTEEKPYTIYFLNQLKRDKFTGQIISKPLKSYTTINQIGDLIVELKKEYNLKESFILSTEKETGFVCVNNRK